MTAPFAEEFFKALTAFAALYILGKKDLQSVLIAGLSSGFGFQISIKNKGGEQKKLTNAEINKILEEINFLEGRVYD